MKFHLIDQENWNRKITYDNFYHNLPCTYSITVNLDITKLYYEVKKSELKFFPTFLYGITSTVNKYKEFRMNFNTDGKVGYYQLCYPNYTVFHKDTETFSSLWTKYSDNYLEFIENYDTDMEQYGKDIHGKPSESRSNFFNVSCLPWTTFTGFNLNLQKGYDYLPPIFTMGKFFEENNKVFIPLAIQGHHAVCDGFHLSRFIKDLEEWGNEFGQFQ